MEHHLQQQPLQQQQDNDDGGRDQYLQYQMPKVMTDEQIEELRKQIVAYTVISRQLIETHAAMSAMSARQNFTGGNPYYDPMAMVGSYGHKMNARQRWTPTPLQLKKLESIFNKGNGTPSKQRIKDITAKLSKHGQISETNVYNWFQNRRARTKKKLPPPSGSGSASGSASITAEAEPDAAAANANANANANADQGLAIQDINTAKPHTLEFIDNPNPAHAVDEGFYLQHSDVGPEGLEELIGTVELPKGYDSYSDIVEEFGYLE